MMALFVHGWGFDSSIWSGVAALLPELRFAMSDRGYFGAPVAPLPTEPVVAVTHSFGAMRVLRDPPPNCRGLVAINGFDSFTARDETPGVHPRIVERMLTRFASDPATVLSDFRRRCGSDAPFGSFDPEPLREDLEALRDWDCTAVSADWQLPIFSLQGAADPILVPAMLDHTFSGAPLLERMTLPDGGHLLPLTHPEFCARQIATFIERLP
jgi:pimeloyl-[acyl-carrier protein] methyl ester esterase